MPLIFPQLPGLAWPIDADFGNFDTRIEIAVSGREVRYPTRTIARVRRVIAIDGMDSDGSWSTLTAQSLQTLVGFYHRCLGPALVFYYWDPDDNSVQGHEFGIGDGSKTTFQLVRSQGGWIDPIFAPFIATAAALIPSAAAPNSSDANVYAPNNIMVDSQAPASSWSASGGGLSATLTPGAADPNGGTLGVTFAEAATGTSSHFERWFGTNTAGVPFIFSAYLKQGGSRYGQLILDDGSNNGCYGNFDLQTGVVTHGNHSGSGASPSPLFAISPADGGFWRCSVSTLLSPSAGTVRVGLCGVNNNPNSGGQQTYLGSPSNTMVLAFPQLELATAIGVPTPYNPTLATPYFGSPSISVGGTYVDPTTYTISNGAVTFMSAPGSGQALLWTGNFYWPCNWDDDKLSLSHIMRGLWEGKKMAFTTRIL